MPYASWVTRSSGNFKRVRFECRCRACVQHCGLSGFVPPLPVVIPPVVPQSRVDSIILCHPPPSSR
eukprot:75762-Rhodomonas_salina.1